MGLILQGKLNVRTARSHQRWNDRGALSTAPVELVKMSAGQEVVRERLGVAHALNTGVHEAGVAKVTEASGTFFCRDWLDKHRFNHELIITEIKQNRFQPA